MSEAALFFTPALLHWHRHVNRRELIWKDQKDPYRIWLSEIILQQTRAEQGRPYYEKFTEAYPTVRALADAPDEEVFRLWQGLGYYNRCRNLLATARHIAYDLQGAFPRSYEGLLALKGVGAYTAAAIGSFAFGLPTAVVDGNVYRVLSRFFGIDTPIDSSAGKAEFAELAQNLIDPEQPGPYNQAIMDFGATVCKPLAPLCPGCPLRPHCAAYREGRVGMLPVKGKKTAVRERYFHYLLLHHEGRLWIRKREQGIWSNLFEPLLIEADAELGVAGLLETAGYREALGADDPARPDYEGTLTHQLTHQKLQLRFFSLGLSLVPEGLPAGGRWVPFADLSQYAFPQALVKYFQKKDYF